MAFKLVEKTLTGRGVVDRNGVSVGISSTGNKLRFIIMLYNDVLKKSGINIGDTVTIETDVENNLCRLTKSDSPAAYMVSTNGGKSGKKRGLVGMSIKKNNRSLPYAKKRARRTACELVETTDNCVTFVFPDLDYIN